jgi:tetratricopeptide (TPR) repeat protein
MKKLGAILMIVGALGAAAWYFWGEVLGGESESGTWSTEDSIEGGEVAMPDLDRLVFGEGVSAEDRERLSAEIGRISSSLRDDPTNYASWLDLASYRKLAGDFSGAEEIWLYTAATWPNDRAAYENLGDLYHLYIRDYPRAERFYRAALERDRTYPALYLKLHELYTLSWEEKKNLADDVLLEGLEKLPGHVGLLFTLAEFYAKEGESEKAREYYSEVRTLAANAGDSETVERVDEAVAALGDQ